jgi:hypothetical protein
VEPFESRKTLIIAMVFVLALLGFGLLFTNIGDSYRQVHCQVHFPSVTCGPEKNS